MRILCLGTILVVLEVVHVTLLAQLELREVSWEWGRNNTFQIFGNYNENYLLLVYAETSAQRNATYTFSLSTLCVTHPASCLAGFLAPSGHGGLFMPLLKRTHSHAAFLPFLPLPGLLQKDVLQTALLDSLSCNEIATSCVRAGEGTRPQISFKTKLWNQARSLSFAISQSLF